MSYDVIESEVTITLTRISTPIAFAGDPPGHLGTPIRKAGDLWDRAYKLAEERGISTDADDWAYMYADDEHLHIYWETARETRTDG